MRVLLRVQAAKRAVAVALRNRWRRHRLPAEIAEEVGAPGCSSSHTAAAVAAVACALAETCAPAPGWVQLVARAKCLARLVQCTALLASL